MSRSVKIRAIGDSVVPELVYQILMAILETDRRITWERNE